MKTATQTKPCWYCDHLIELAIESTVRIDTLQSILNKGEKAYAHELCHAQAENESNEEKAMEDLWEEHAGPMYYDRGNFDGEY